MSNKKEPLFEQIAKQNLPCEVCGSATKALYGGGQYQDRIVCAFYKCGAEILFATSTVLEDGKDE